MPAVIDTRNLVRRKCEKGTTYSPCWKGFCHLPPFPRST